jgi:hypothetical protein
MIPICTGWPKSRFTENKIEYLQDGSSNQADFFIRPLPFNSGGGVQSYLAKGLSRLVIMDLKLEHASITDKKISSFARTVMEIFDFCETRPERKC